MIIKHSSAAMKYCQEETSFPYSIANYLSLTLSYLADSLKDGSSESKGSHWRLLEIFLNFSSWKQNLGDELAVKVAGSLFKIIAQKGKVNYVSNMRINTHPLL